MTWRKNEIGEEIPFKKKENRSEKKNRFLSQNIELNAYLKPELLLSFFFFLS